MAAKSTTAKSYKIPGSKGREARIKKCPCEKGKDKMPLIQRSFIATEFEGRCCEACFEITTFDLITPEDEKNKNNSGGVGEISGGALNNEEDGRDGDDF